MTEFNFDNVGGVNPPPPETESVVTNPLTGNNEVESMFNFSDDNLESGPTGISSMGQQANINVEDYSSYMNDKGVYLNANNDQIRADNQSKWEQLGLALGRVPQNVVGGLIADVGYMAELPSVFSPDPDDDFNNWFIETGEWIKKNNVANLLSSNNKGEIYMDNPGKTWNPGEFAWWMEHGGNGIQSMIEFATLGMGVGKLATSVTSKAARGMAKMVNNGSKFINRAGKLSSTATQASEGIGQASKWYMGMADATAHITGGSALAMAEGGSAAKETYDYVKALNDRPWVQNDLERDRKKYNDEYGTNVSLEDFKRMRQAEAAANTYKTSMLMNVALNSMQLGIIAKSPASKSILNKELSKHLSQASKQLGRKLTPNEKKFLTRKYIGGDAKTKGIDSTVQALGTRGQLEGKSFWNKSKSFIGTGLSEGVEELNTYYATARGKRMGDKGLLEEDTNMFGVDNSIAEQYGGGALGGMTAFMADYLQAVSNEEGWNNFFWGALLGQGHMVFGAVQGDKGYKYVPGEGIVQTDETVRGFDRQYSLDKANLERESAELLNDMEAIDKANTEIDLMMNDIIDNGRAMTDLEKAKMEQIQTNLLVNTEFLRSLRNGTQDIILDDIKSLLEINPNQRVSDALGQMKQEFNSRTEDLNNKLTEANTELTEKITNSEEPNLVQAAVNQVLNGEVELANAELEEDVKKLVSEVQSTQKNIQANLAEIESADRKIEEFGSQTIGEKMELDPDHQQRLGRILNILEKGAESYEKTIAYGRLNPKEQAWAEQIWRVKQKALVMEELANQAQGKIEKYFTDNGLNYLDDAQLIDSITSEKTKSEEIVEDLKRDLAILNNNLSEIDKANIISAFGKIDVAIEDANISLTKKEVDELIENQPTDVAARKLEEKGVVGINSVEIRALMKGLSESKSKGLSSLAKVYGSTESLTKTIEEIDKRGKGISLENRIKEAEELVDKYKKQLIQANIPGSSRAKLRRERATRLVLDKMSQNAQENIMLMLNKLVDGNPIDETALTNPMDFVEENLKEAGQAVTILAEFDRVSDYLNELITEKGKKQFLKEYSAMIEKHKASLEKARQDVIRKNVEKAEEEAEELISTANSNTSQSATKGAINALQNKKKRGSNTSPAVINQGKAILSQNQKATKEAQEAADAEDGSSEDTNWLTKEQWQENVEELRSTHRDSDNSDFALAYDAPSATLVQDELLTYLENGEEYHMVAYVSRWTEEIEDVNGKKRKVPKSTVKVAPVLSKSEDGNFVYIVETGKKVGDDWGSKKIPIADIESILGRVENMKIITPRETPSTTIDYEIETEKTKNNKTVTIVKLPKEEYSKYESVSIKDATPFELRSLVTKHSLLSKSVNGSTSIGLEVIDVNEAGLLVYSPISDSDTFYTWSTLAEAGYTKLMVDKTTLGNTYAEMMNKWNTISSTPLNEVFNDVHNKEHLVNQKQTDLILNDPNVSEAVKEKIRNLGIRRYKYFNRNGNLSDTELAQQLIEAEEAIPSAPRMSDSDLTQSLRNEKNIDTIGVSKSGSKGFVISQDTLTTAVDALLEANQSVLIGTSASEYYSVIAKQDGVYYVAQYNDDGTLKISRRGASDIKYIKVENSAKNLITTDDALPNVTAFNEDIAKKLLATHDIKLKSYSSVTSLAQDLQVGDNVALHFQKEDAKSKKTPYAWSKVIGITGTRNRKTIQVATKIGDKTVIQQIKAPDVKANPVFIARENSNISAQMERVKNRHEGARAMKSRTIQTSTRPVKLNPGYESAGFRTSYVDNAELGELLDKGLIQRGDMILMQEDPWAMEVSVTGKNPIGEMLVWEVLPGRGVLFLHQNTNEISFKSLKQISKETAHGVIFTPEHFRKNKKEINNIANPAKEPTVVTKGVFVTGEFESFLQGKTDDQRREIRAAGQRLSDYIEEVGTLAGYKIKIAHVSEFPNAPILYDKEFLKDRDPETQALYGHLIDSEGSEVFVNGIPLIIPIPSGTSNNKVAAMRRAIGKDGATLSIPTKDKQRGFNSGRRAYELKVNGKTVHAYRFGVGKNIKYRDINTGEIYEDVTVGDTKSINSFVKDLQNDQLVEVNFGETFTEIEGVTDYHSGGFMFARFANSPYLKLMYSMLGDGNNDSLKEVYLNFLLLPADQRDDIISDENGYELPLSEAINNFININTPVENNYRQSNNDKGDRKGDDRFGVRFDEKDPNILHVMLPAENGRVAKFQIRSNGNSFEFVKGRDSANKSALRLSKLGNDINEEGAADKVMNEVINNTYVRPNTNKWNNADETMSLPFFLNGEFHLSSHPDTTYQDFWMNYGLFTNGQEQLSAPTVYVEFDTESSTVKPNIKKKGTSKVAKAKPATKVMKSPTTNPDVGKKKAIGLAIKIEIVDTITKLPIINSELLDANNFSQSILNLSEIDEAVVRVREFNKTFAKETGELRKDKTNKNILASAIRATYSGLLSIGDLESFVKGDISVDELNDLIASNNESYIAEKNTSENTEVEQSDNAEESSTSDEETDNIDSEEVLEEESDEVEESTSEEQPTRLGSDRKSIFSLGKALESTEQVEETSESKEEKVEEAKEVEEAPKMERKQSLSSMFGKKKETTEEKPAEKPKQKFAGLSSKVSRDRAKVDKRDKFSAKVDNPGIRRGGRLSDLGKSTVGESRIKGTTVNKAELQEQIDWFRANISSKKSDLQFVQGLIHNGAYGAFMTDGSVLISDLAPSGTIYHEALERVWNAYLTEEQQDSVIDEMAQSENFQSEFDAMQQLYPELDSRGVVKEMIAEAFREYNLTGDISQENTSMLKKFIKSIIDLFNKLTGLNKSAKKELFDKINRGKFKGYAGKNFDSAINQLINDNLIERIC